MNCIFILEKNIEDILKLDLKECFFILIKNGETIFSICSSNKEKLEKIKEVVRTEKIDNIGQEYQLSSISFEELRRKYGN